MGTENTHAASDGAATSWRTGNRFTEKQGSRPDRAQQAPYRSHDARSGLGGHYHHPQSERSGSFRGQIFEAKVVSLSRDKNPIGVFVVLDRLEGGGPSSHRGERALVRSNTSVVVDSLAIGERVRVIGHAEDNRGRLVAKLAPAKTRIETKDDEGVVSTGRPLLILDLNGVLCDRGAYKSRQGSNGAAQKLSLRPHALSFLSWCFERFDVGVWSCGKRENMEMSLFDGRSLVFAWDQAMSTSLWPRTSSVSVDKPLFLKEIGKVWGTTFVEEQVLDEFNWRTREPKIVRTIRRYGPKNTLLLDNHAEKFERNDRKNCCVVPTWDARITNDDVLATDGELVKAIETFAKTSNFPKQPDALWQMQQPPAPLDKAAGGGRSGRSRGRSKAVAEIGVGRQFAEIYCSSPVHRKHVPDYPASRYIELGDSPGPRAKPLRWRELEEVVGRERFVATEKTDGERGWFFEREGLGTFLLRRDLTVAAKLDEDGGTTTILDGEMIADQCLFVVFDCVICERDDVGAIGTGGAPTRLRRAEAALDRIASRGLDWRIIAKQYWRPDDADFEANVRAVLETSKYGDDKRQTRADGVVLARLDDDPDAGYYTAACFKHKSTVTLDFRLVDGGRAGDIVEGSVEGGGRDLAVAHVELDSARARGAIVECIYSRGLWRVKRTRHDKKRPNPLRTAWNALETLAEPIGVQELVEIMRRPYNSRLKHADGKQQHDAAEHYDAIQRRRNDKLLNRVTDKIHRLRRLNNLVKALTIERFARRRMPTPAPFIGRDDVKVLAALRQPITSVSRSQHRSKPKATAAVLELACGRGGDLGKWRINFDVTALVAVDASQLSLQAAKKRWQNRNTAIFRLGDIGDDDLPGLISKSAEALGTAASAWADFASCQFALHYACGSEKRLDACLTATAQALKPSGTFIATVVDWLQLQRLFETTDQAKISDLCAIAAPDDTVSILRNLQDQPDSGAYGLRYTFSLGDAVEKCDEFVVHVPTLAALAEKKGLVLTAALPFSILLSDELRLFPDAFATLAADMGVRPSGTADANPALSDEQYTVSSLYLALAFTKREVSAAPQSDCATQDNPAGAAADSEHGPAAESP